MLALVKAAALASIALIGAMILVGCGPPLDRTPRAPSRIDAGTASAEAPTWNPGDTWRYRGSTFDSRDNRFHERVLGEVDGTYEVDTPEYVDFIDVRTLRLVRHREKKTGEMRRSFSLNPLWFPLNASGRYSMTGTRIPKGEAERPYSANCHVVSYEDVEVHAGTFAAFRIDCETNDGFAEHWYAPAVKNLVKIRWMGNRESFVAELWAYELAK